MTKRIAEYGSVKILVAKNEMQFVVNETARLIASACKDDKSLFQFAAIHKNEVLLWLPPVLGTGQLLGNNNLDDRTNKMEGPISSLLHTIEKNFS